jgi:hypothetical protein
MRALTPTPRSPRLFIDPGTLSQPASPGLLPLGTEGGRYLAIHRQQAARTVQRHPHLVPRPPRPLCPLPLLGRRRPRLITRARIIAHGLQGQPPPTPPLPRCHRLARRPAEGLVHAQGLQPQQHLPGAGEENGIDQNKSWLRFTYDSAKCDPIISPRTRRSAQGSHFLCQSVSSGTECQPLLAPRSSRGGSALPVAAHSSLPRSLAHSHAPCPSGRSWRRGPSRTPPAQARRRGCEPARARAGTQSSRPPSVAQWSPGGGAAAANKHTQAASASQQQQQQQQQQPGYQRGRAEGVTRPAPP